MTRTDEELATKIVYLKENHYMPNIDDEMPDVQHAIQSFYFCSKSTTKDSFVEDEFLSSIKTPYDVDRLKNDDFWFKLTFTDYQVSDNFVREVNREYKRFKILNIGKNEFGPNFQ